MLLQWCDKYGVGIDEFDEQHKTLFNTINEIYENYLKEIKKNNIKDFDFISKIRNFYIKHAKYEEKLMIKHKYPRYAEHKTKHDTIIEMTGFFSSDPEHRKKIDYDAFFNFLSDWLVEHFATEDMALANYLLNTEV